MTAHLKVNLYLIVTIIISGPKIEQYRLNTRFRMLGRNVIFNNICNSQMPESKWNYIGSRTVWSIGLWQRSYRTL